MAPGEELESERYLITIEERLHALSDHAHEVRSTTQEKEVKDSVGPLYQPGKRKRQVFILIASSVYTCVWLHLVRVIVAKFIAFMCS